MNLSAVKIAEQILQKTAVSRWREAIYSGELPLEQREMLKSRMGVTPERAIAGIDRGNAARLGKMQIGIENPIKDLIQHVRTQPSPFSKKNKMSLMQKIGPVAMGSHSSFGTIKQVPLIDNVNLLGLLATNKSEPIRKRVQGLLAQTRELGRGLVRGKDSTKVLTLAHEIDEATIKPFRSAYSGLFRSLVPGATLPTSYSPELYGTLARGVYGADPEIMKAFMPNVVTSTANKLKQLGGEHAHPAVLMNEIRSSRMLSPDTQRVRASLRDASGEFTGAGKSVENLNIPNPRKPAGNQLARQLQMFQDLKLEQVGRKYSIGLQRGEKLKNLLARLR